MLPVGQILSLFQGQTVTHMQVAPMKGNVDEADKATFVTGQ